MRNLIAVSLIAVATALPVQAQDAPTQTPAGAVEFIASQDVTDMRVSEWIGTPIKSAAGETVGDINDFVFTRDGSIKAVVTGVGGFLGIGEKNVAVPLQSVEMKRGPEGARSAMVNVTKDELSAAPRFESSSDRNWEARKEQMSEDARSAYERAKESVKKGYEATKEAAKKGYERAQEAIRGSDTPNAEPNTERPAN